MYHRMFDLHTAEDKYTINFHDFVCALSNLHSRTPLEQKIRFVFEIFDVQNDDEIDLDEIKVIMTPLFQQAGISLTGEQMQGLLMDSFNITDPTQKLPYSEFFMLCKKAPQILTVFTLPLDLTQSAGDCARSQDDDVIPESRQSSCWDGLLSDSGGISRRDSGSSLARRRSPKQGPMATPR